MAPSSAEPEILPIQQLYHDEATVQITGRLTPEGEDPGRADYLVSDVSWHLQLTGSASHEFWSLGFEGSLIGEGSFTEGLDGGTLSDFETDDAIAPDEHQLPGDTEKQFNQVRTSPFRELEPNEAASDDRPCALRIDTSGSSYDEMHLDAPPDSPMPYPKYDYDGDIYMTDEPAVSSDCSTDIEDVTPPKVADAPPEDNHEDSTNSGDGSDQSEGPASNSPPGAVSEARAGQDGVFYEQREYKGALRWDRLKRCTKCEELVSLGEGKTLHAFHQHENGEKCKASAKRVRSAKGQTRITDLFRPKPSAKPIPPSSTSSTPGVAAPTPAACIPTASGSELARSSPRILVQPNAPSVVRSAQPPILRRTTIVDFFAEQQLCPGVRLDWPGVIFRAYPWHLHAFENLSYELQYFDSTNGSLYVRSRSCQRMPKVAGAPCTECASIPSSAEVERMRLRASGVISITTNYKYHTYDQLYEVIKTRNDERNKLKLDVLKLSRQYQAATARLTDHEHFMQTLALDDMSGVGRIVAVAIRNRRSPREITRRLELSLRGLYHVKSFSQANFDAQRLVLSFGGPKLAYALSKALDLPAVRTTQKHLTLPSMRACITFPTAADIDHNISTMHETGVLWPTNSVEPRRRGFSLLMDEIAVEERPHYDSSRDAVVGMAREDAESCDLHNVTLETLHGIADALHEGTISRAKEATVAAVAPFDADHYTPVPILVSGTNKTETDVKQYCWIKLLLDRWRSGPVRSEELYGPIWSVASDGDATRRRALHRLLLQRSLSYEDPLYALLSPLPRMNLWCGEYAQTADFDYKHKFKNLASGLRNRQGILVAGAHVTPVMLKQSLALLPNMTRARIENMFNNKDHQNVPNAVSLLSSLADLAELSTFNNEINHQPIVLLGIFCGLLVRPYKSPNMSLFQQLVSLSAAGHLLLVLYRHNKTSFCPGQWYYDVQTFIKNAFWTVARQKLLQPDGSLHLTQTGDDRLEVEFGIIRLMNNSRNVDVLELTHRIAATAITTPIFARHPDWDRGHRRLRLDGVEGVDHTNPASWKGDVNVSHISLLTAWNQGRRDVQEVLRSLHIPFDDFPTLPDNVDLLRPFGAYVGLRAEADADKWDCTAEGSAADDNLNADLDPTDESENGLAELEDLLPEPDVDDLDDVRKKDKYWLKLPNGQSCHKSSAVRYLLCSDDGKKSTDRLHRVQGLSKVRTYSREPSAPSLNDDSLLGDAFLVNQLVATFARVDNQVALAIMRVSAIEDKAKTLVPSISASDLSSPEITLRGQILTLSPADSSTWVWTPNTYESFTSKKQDKALDKAGPLPTNSVTRKSTLVDVLACLTTPIKVKLEQANQDSPSIVWKFDTKALGAVTDVLWSNVRSHIKSIPARFETTTFPYRDETGSYSFVNQEATDAVQAGPKEGYGECYLCGKEESLKKMRHHVARHLLAHQLRMSDELLQPIGELPCGFCGRSGTCSVGLAKPSKAVVPTSDCPYSIKFSLVAADKTTSSGPSTNRPMQCQLCLSQDPPGRYRLANHVYWSYNLSTHLDTKHPSTPIPDEFENSYMASQDEMIHLGLAKGTVTTKMTKRGPGRKRKLVGESAETPRAKQHRA